MHKVKPANGVPTTLANYAGESSDRKRSTADIVKGWRDTDACLRALFAMSPYRLKAENGFLLANRMLAGAFKFAKPNGNFAGAFAGSSQGDAQKISAVYEKFLNGRHYDQLVNNQGKIAALRDDLKAVLGIVEER